VGMLAGGGLGIVAAAAGLAPGIQVAVSNIVLAAALAATSSWQPQGGNLRREENAPRRRFRDLVTPQLALLAAIAFLIAFTENASAQWSALYTTQGLGASAAAGAATYTALSTSSVVARVVGDRIMQRFGRIRFLVVSGFIAAAGLAAALIVGTAVVAFVGFAILGFGTACVYPTVVSFAGNQPGTSAAEGVWVMETGQQPGFLLAPVLVGVLASAAGLRVALVSVVVTTVAVTLLCSRIRVMPATEPAPDHAAADGEVAR
jgi:fucose permease